MLFLYLNFIKHRGVEQKGLFLAIFFSDKIVHYQLESYFEEGYLRFLMESGQYVIYGALGASILYIPLMRHSSKVEFPKKNISSDGMKLCKYFSKLSFYINSLIIICALSVRQIVGEYFKLDFIIRNHFLMFLKEMFHENDDIDQIDDLATKE
jgi:hypothetical protein